MSQSLRPELLVRHWDDLNRLAASLKDGLVAPSLIIAKEEPVITGELRPLRMEKIA